MDVLLDGRNMTSVEETHLYLAQKFNLDSYYGKNLDALFDILTSVSNMRVVLIFVEVAFDHHPLFIAKLIETFEDAALENSGFLFYYRKKLVARL